MLTTRTAVVLYGGHCTTGIRYVLDIEGSLDDEAAGRCNDSPANPKEPDVPLTTCGVIGELCRLVCCCKCR